MIPQATVPRVPHPEIERALTDERGPLAGHRPLPHAAQGSSESKRVVGVELAEREGITRERAAGDRRRRIVFAGARALGIELPLAQYPQDTSSSTSASHDFEEAMNLHLHRDGA